MNADMDRRLNNCHEIETAAKPDSGTCRNKNNSNGRRRCDGTCTRSKMPVPRPCDNRRQRGFGPHRQHSLPEKTESNLESADRFRRFPYRAGRLYLYIFIPEHSNNLNI